MPTRTPKAAKNRIHLDLSTTSGEDQQDVVRRLVADGAARVDIGQGEVSWVVLADPEGNEFCVTAPNDAAFSRLGGIAFDAHDPVAQGAFWSAATAWVVETQGEWGVALRHPSGQGPALTLGPPVAPKHEKARVHLDVAPFAGDDHDAEVERLLSLGADRVETGQGDVPWAVLADPEGNEFCILTPR